MEVFLILIGAALILAAAFVLGWIACAIVVAGTRQDELQRRIMDAEE